MTIRQLCKQAVRAAPAPYLRGRSKEKKLRLLMSPKTLETFFDEVADQRATGTPCLCMVSIIPTYAGIRLLAVDGLPDGRVEVVTVLAEASL